MPSRCQLRKAVSHRVLRGFVPLEQFLRRSGMGEKPTGAGPIAQPGVPRLATTRSRVSSSDNDRPDAFHGRNINVRMPSEESRSPAPDPRAPPTAYCHPGMSTQHQTKATASLPRPPGTCDGPAWQRNPIDRRSRIESPRHRAAICAARVDLPNLLHGNVQQPPSQTVRCGQQHREGLIANP